ncbi:MAG: SDR family oxidoreductase [Roseiflexaceae bacterium]
MAVLTGKVALVTGASRGIGRAIALRLGRDGARVVVTYHANREQAEAVVAEIIANGSDAIAIQADVSQANAIGGLFSAVLERFGQVDILINNAASTSVFKPTALLNEAEYDQMFAVTRGVYFMLQQAAQHLADGGRVINISTAGTLQSMAGGGAYTGSKAAIEQFSLALAKELGPRGITVNTISPGVTRTDGLVLPPEQVGYLVSQTPLGRLGEPIDIADAVALLASPDARWVSGQNLRVTGGMI